MEVKTLDSTLYDLIYNCDVFVPILEYPANQINTQEESAIPTFKRAVSVIQNLSTKMSITCKDSDDPTDAIPSVTQMSHAISVVIQSAVSVISEIQAGPFVSQIIRTKVKNLVGAVKNLAINLKKHAFENDNIAILTATVWEGCKALSELTLDNKTATLASLRLIQQPLKDAVMELEEFSKSANNPAEDAIDEDEEEDDGTFIDLSSSTKLTPEELVLLPGALQIVKMAYVFVQRIEKIVQMTTNDQNERSYGIWLSDLYMKCREISETVDNFCVLIDPPLDRQDLEEKFRNIIDTLSATINIIKQNPISNRESIQVLLDSFLQKFNIIQLLNPK